MVFLNLDFFFFNLFLGASWRNHKLKTTLTKTEEKPTLRVLKILPNIIIALLSCYLNKILALEEIRCNIHDITIHQGKVNEFDFVIMNFMKAI